jgi:hypothetical protein
MAVSSCFVGFIGGPAGREADFVGQLYRNLLTFKISGSKNYFLINKNVRICAGSPRASNEPWSLITPYSYRLFGIIAFKA